ncbi:MAG: polysaccharide deacetylase family protein [Candidatus Omnitrophota bacterium]
MKLNLKKILKIFFAGLFVSVLIFLCTATLYLRQHYTVPILMYHSVGEPRSSKDNLLTVSSATFERQMKFLSERNYNVISLSQLAKFMKDKAPIPARSVVITFDDGYRNNLTVAFPILKKYNLAATIFVAPKEISVVPDYLNWNELKELSDSPLIEIGSHSLDHNFLLDIKDKDGLVHRIRNSKKILQKLLDEPVDLFSYPGGGFNKEIRQMVIDSGYVSAVATKPGLRYPENDIFALKRISIREKDKNLFVFRMKLSGFYVAMKDWQRRHKDVGIKYYE